MQRRWFRDPYRSFRTVLAIVVLTAVLGLSVAVSLVLQRFYVNETMEITTRGVESHFRLVFSTDIFRAGVANRDQFDRMVRLHFGLYDIVDVQMYRADGTWVYGYGAPPDGSLVPAGLRQTFRAALQGQQQPRWAQNLTAPDGRTYSRVLRILVPIRDEGPNLSAVPGHTAHGAEAGHAGDHGDDYGYSGGSAPAPDGSAAGPPESASPVIGVAVVYRDATKGLALLRSVQVVAVLVLLGFGLALYLGLGRLFLQATRQIRSQSAMLENALVQLEQSHNSTLQTLSRALDARDHETEGHSLRVAYCCIRLARAIGLSGAALDDIFKGALLHDVGKIAVPDAVLRKPGPLTDEEWAEMRRHPAAGYEILKDLPFMRGALPVVLHHHERWDGQGYPDRLSGEEIPLGARIFAIIDTLDAITSDRPYRQARSVDEAQAEIRRCAGSQFDPEVVDAFLRIPAQEWQEIRRFVANGEMPRSGRTFPETAVPLAGD